jgi:hypothetical protein
MKSKLLLLLLALILLTQSTFAAKLVFNQIINNAGNLAVPSNTTNPPASATIFTVPAGKVWKVNLSYYCLQSWYILSGNTQVIKVNGNIAPTYSWLNGGDVVTLEATNITGNGQGLTYTLFYSYTIIEFNVVP